MDLVSRLKQYLIHFGISVTQFADECEIPRPSASQLLAGRNKKVSDEIIGKIHRTYPDLSIIWLMFGEGSMVTDANMPSSQPQNSHNQEQNSAEEPMGQAHAGSQSNLFSMTGKDAENSTQPTNPSQFTFSPASAASAADMNRSFSPQPPEALTSAQLRQEYHAKHTSDPNGKTIAQPTPKPKMQNGSSTFTFGASAAAPSADASATSLKVTADRGKRVVSIMVYYSDSTFEAFVPDPEGMTPFMR